MIPRFANSGSNCPAESIILGAMSPGKSTRSSSALLNISSRGFVSSMIVTSTRPICGRRLPFIASATALVVASALGSADG
jgi:hypothetical protein